MPNNKKPLVVIIFFLVTLAAFVVPFNFFVDVDSVNFKNMCQGDSLQLLETYRKVKWLEAYTAHVQSDVIKFENQKKVETTLFRSRDFIYQKSETQPVVVTIEWNKPIMEPGVYGVNEIVTIEPFLFKKKYVLSEDEHMFVVYPAEHVHCQK